ncbi:ATP-binding cassette domain-containing protein, partial [Microbacterium sp.]|uniref:ABC transporter ATP-binding protein n=1 Tax=Microbacterium sp. TaxID=51671 RepID=UPI0026229C46
MHERPRMPDGQLIEFDRVTKRFGAVAAVSDFSARVNPGVVTGFLGPNGAGKTTTLRMLLGLERPTIGTTKIGGKRFSELRNPARVIGAMLEDPGFRARRTVERHLIAAAKANGVSLSRVGELISFVGLSEDVDTRVAALSLGMRQRLSAATALIGDPGVLVLDEPANGLDPEGIRWMRTLIRGLADEGRTVLVSSHVLSEVEQIADEILVISRGELKFAGTMEDLADPSTGPVVVDAPDRSALSDALHGAGFEFEILRSGLTVRGSDAATIGGVTASAGVALTTLQQRGPTLEDVFLDLVNDRYVPTPKTDAAAAEPVTADDEPIADDASTHSASDRDIPTAEQEPVAEPVEEVAPDDTADAESVDVSGGDAASTDAETAAEPTEAPTATEPVTEPVEASEPDRPLPGIAGLAAVASHFTAPADAGGAGDTDDPDATRIINTVPGSAPFADDTAETDSNVESEAQASDTNTQSEAQAS